MKRYAIVRNADDRRHAEAYLPGNYRIVAEVIERTEQFSCISPNGKEATDKLVFVIEGEDVAGWTLDGYVIPRYLSCPIGCEEIDLSHPIMKTVPLNPAEPDELADALRGVDITPRVTPGPKMLVGPDDSEHPVQQTLRERRTS